MGAGKGNCGMGASQGHGGLAGYGRARAAAKVAAVRDGTNRRVRLANKTQRSRKRAVATAYGADDPSLKLNNHRK